MRLDVYKRATILEKLSYKFKTLSNNFVLSELKTIRRYYKENALENCNEDLRPVVNHLFTSVFGLDMFSSERTSEAMKPRKDASKRFCLLSLAHMTSKLTRNSKNYPEEVVDELKDFLGDIERRAERIQNISVAPMEPFVDSVKSVFNADMVVTQDNYNKLDYVKNTRALVNTCLDHPNRLGLQDVNENIYNDRDIEPGDIRREDIDAGFNKFLKSIESNIMGANSGDFITSKPNSKVLNLLNLINGKDEQDRKEIEDLNKKIQVEDVYGQTGELDSQNLVDRISNFRK